MGLSDKINNKYNPETNIFTLHPPVPKKHIQIEISNLCNYDCIFCPRHKSKRKKGYIDEKLFQRVLQEAYDMGAREMSFHFSGEPFLHPKLADFVAMSKAVGMEYVYINTNGALATPEKVKAVIDAGVDSIKFSINAATEKTYEFIHGRDAFKEVVSNINYCNQYRAAVKPDLKLYVSCVYTKYTQDEKELIKELFAFCDEVVFLHAADFSGVMPEVNTLLRGSGDNDYANRVPCSMVFGGIYVTYEGYLSACCTNFDNHVVVADLNKMSLKEAWYGEEMTRLRKRHLNNDLKGTVCYNCVNHTSEPFEPLIKELAPAVDMDFIYNNDFVAKRIEQFN